MRLPNVRFERPGGAGFRSPTRELLNAAQLLLLLVCTAPTVLSQWHSIGAVDSLSQIPGQGVRLVASGAQVTVMFLVADLVRVQMTPPGQPAVRDSWSVVRSAWTPEAIRQERRNDTLVLASDSLRVILRLRPLRIAFADPAGRILQEDHPGKGMSWMPRLQPDPTRDTPGQPGAEVRVWKRMPDEESYYGFGQRAGKFLRNGTHMVNWNSDIPAYGPDTDPLYQSIPFFYSIRQGRACGVFFDNTYRSTFDMGVENRDQFSFGAEAGDLTYYFFAGPTPARVLQRFTELVGTMPLPPLWSLGYQQCRWSYTPEARVRHIAREFRDRSMPCDVVYLDIDYMDGYRIFTWHPTSFPNPAKLVSDLARDGFRVAVILDPGIKVDTAYTAYRTGLAGNHFLRYPDGSLFTGEVWPGRCAFPDFTSSSARRWWGDQFADLVRTGIKGWWNDMNEPSVFNVSTKTVDGEVLHDDEGRQTPHARSHNVYGMQMTRATYEGVLRHNPAERPFVLTRASFAGGHRYSAAWTGDNVASWEHLRMALSMCLGMSISGQPFVGSDIGGFIGYPSGELFTRWLQLGVFTPLMRGHSVINERNKEPWEFGDSLTALNRAALNLRYQLLPYIYTVMEEASSTGIPAMRPLVFHYPADNRYVHEATTFLFGRDLLVAPVLWEGVRQRDVELPEGVWYEFFTGTRHEGKRRVTLAAPLAVIPVLARAGAVIPLRQVVQYVDQAPIDPLTLVVFPAEQQIPVVSPLYEDDGRTFAYRDGMFSRRTVTQVRTNDRFTVAISAQEGKYAFPPRALVIRVVGMTRPPSGVTLNDIPVPRSEASGKNGQPWWHYLERAGTLELTCSDTRTAQRISLAYGN